MRKNFSEGAFAVRCAAMRQTKIASGRPDVAEKKQAGRTSCATQYNNVT